MTRIFISYRREDSAYVAGILSNKIQGHFGKDSIFMDVDDIPFGVDFRKHISNAVGKCGILLALIGDLWINVRDKDGRRRIDNPTDFVRLEIDTALTRNIPVVPVLVGNALMPQENELPDPLKPLAYRNAAEIRSGRDLWHHIETLIRGIESQIQTETSEIPIQPDNVRQSYDQVLDTNSVAVIGDNSAIIIADLLRSKSFKVVTETNAYSKTILFAIDAADGPMPVHRNILKNITLASNQELQCVLTNTIYVSDTELLELLELGIREMLCKYNFNGDNVVIYRHPRDSNNLINFIMSRH